ncbi:MAG: ADP-glyceromanno-heptose 6-epimerase [Rhodospirillaceae bacterium]|jgi:ADP-L-glycero-D-manno-heptose 6-epimerase|nr:ADP-glyceromanno-heptose 6-epimerase [Rhodospirillaceae bacterium]
MYLVTGGAGFIGSNILAALEKRNDGSLVICDRLCNDDKWRNISKREISDIVHPKKMFLFLEANKTRIKAIIHMGAISNTAENDVDLIIANNFNLSNDLFIWCTQNHVRIIYASSASTYGDGAQGFEDNSSNLSLLNPLNAYGWSKHLFDRLIVNNNKMNKQMPPQWVGLKFFNVYGPNEYHKSNQQSLVAQIYSHAKINEPAQLFRSYHCDYQDGGQMRDFIWINDVVDVIMWLLDHQNVNGLFNLGSGKSRTFIDLALTVYHALNKEPNIKYIDIPLNIRHNYQYFTKASMNRLFNVGYTKSFTSLEDGVNDYVVNYLNAKDRYI